MTEIEDAYRLLAPLLGPMAAVLFGVALLAAGQSSTLTATLAGQVVMEGFLRLSWKPWMRKLATRALALVPALFVAALWAERGLSQLLVASQVALSLQLPFAMAPLIWFTADRRRMGAYASPRWLTAVACTIAAAITGMNMFLLVAQFTRW